MQAKPLGRESEPAPGARQVLVVVTGARFARSGAATAGRSRPRALKLCRLLSDLAMDPAVRLLVAAQLLSSRVALSAWPATLTDPDQCEPPRSPFFHSALRFGGLDVVVLQCRRRLGPVPSPSWAAAEAACASFRASISLPIKPLPQKAGWCHLFSPSQGFGGQLAVQREQASPSQPWRQFCVPTGYRQNSCPAGLLYLFS